MGAKDRIYEFCRQKGISILGFEKACGLSNGYVSSIRTSVGLRSLDSIMKAFPELNRDWLLYGEGEMLNENVVIPRGDVPNVDVPEDSVLDPIVIPGAAWVVIQQQSASLERKDRQLDRCISMLETSFALLKGAAVPAAASVAAAGESAG